MVVAPLPRRRRGALSPRRRTPPRHRSAASVLSTTKKSATCAPSWKPNDAPTVPMADGADQPPRGRRATTRPVPNRAEKAKPAFVTRKKACARIEQRVLSRPRRPKRAVKDRAATSSSCYHEDGVEAMLDLCAAKGPGPARAPARPSGGPSSGSRASSRGCAGPACDCPRASRGWSRPAGARTARVDGRRAGALSHSSSSRNVTSPSWPSDAERRSRLSCSGRSGRERIASTTSGYLNVGAPPTATTLSPNFRPNRSASPPGARAESTPSPP